MGERRTKIAKDPRRITENIGRGGWFNATQGGTPKENACGRTENAMKTQKEMEEETHRVTKEKTHGEFTAIVRGKQEGTYHEPIVKRPGFCIKERMKKTWRNARETQWHTQGIYEERTREHTYGGAHATHREGTF